MLNFELLPLEETQDLVRLFTSKKVKFNNYFMNDLTGMENFHSSETLLLKKDYCNFSRVYFISDSEEELCGYLRELDNKDAINVPTKRHLDDTLVEVLIKGGYKLLTVYERLYKNTNEGRGEFEESYAEPEDVNDIENLLIAQLYNPISDRIPSREEILEMVSNKQVLVNRDDNGKVNGALIFVFEGKKCNFLEWASTASVGESLYLYLNAFNLMAEKGIERSTIWVRSDNERPKKIYLSWGYQPDGLKDYTFLKY